MVNKGGGQVAPDDGGDFDAGKEGVEFFLKAAAGRQERALDVGKGGEDAAASKGV